MSDTRPHIIYILSDEHRGQAMSHVGDPNVRTPNMDRMAERGASFGRAYSNCPVCTPSRGTIFSGRHAHAGPVPGFFEVYHPAFPSTATLLRDQGYHTAYFGKWHCGSVVNQKGDRAKSDPDRFPGSGRTPEAHRAGFQDWNGFEVINSPYNTYVYRGHDLDPTPLDGYQTDVLTDEVIRYLENYDRDEPLFLVLSVEPPHFPCEWPPDADRRDSATLKVDPSFAKLNPMFEKRWAELPEDDLRDILNHYLAMVENLDTNIGRLFDTLHAQPRYDNTLSVYFSDHGDYAGNHGLDTTKIHHHEESLRVPAIFHWPGQIPEQGKVNGIFGLVDLQATVLGLLGIDIPRWNQGRNWADHLRGKPFDLPEDMLVEMVGTPRWNPRFQNWRGLVGERWKYAYYEDGRQFLHELERDPYEMENLAASNPEQAEACRKRLLEVLAETREPLFDVIIEHGVEPVESHYLSDPAAQLAGARHKGGLPAESGPAVGFNP